jgi:hypothetical protein
LTELDLDGGTLVLSAPGYHFGLCQYHRLRLLAITTMLEPTLRNIKVIAVA